MSIIWITEKEYKAQKEFFDNFWKEMLWGTHKPYIPQPDDNVKLAWVIINSKREMLGVDNKTMEGFEMNTDTPTWKMPLVPKKYDSFERWCTPFDV